MNVDVQKQARQIAMLRATADVQFKRIADMQAELDVLPAARRRRHMVRALLQPSRSHHGTNGNGRTG
jgi:cell division protein FtsB